MSYSDKNIVQINEKGNVVPIRFIHQLFIRKHSKRKKENYITIMLKYMRPVQELNICVRFVALQLFYNKTEQLNKTILRSGP